MSTPTAYFGKAKSTFSKAELRRQHLGQAAEAGLKFDGAAGKVSNVAAPDLGTQWSIELIIQADVFGSANVNIADWSGSQRIYLGAHSATGYQLGFFRGTGFVSFGVDTLEDLKVHHLVVVVDETANTATLYDNGNQAASITPNGSSSVDTNDTFRLCSDDNGTGNFFAGTVYRARLWNKGLTAAEVTASFENASVPAADRYGVPYLVDAAAGVFTSGTYSWVKYNANTITNVSNTLAIAYVDNAAGAYNYLRDSFDLTTDLTVGKKYQLRVDAKYTGGASGVRLQLWDGEEYTYSAALTTSLVTYTLEFTRAPTGTPFYQLNGLAASNVVTIDNWQLDWPGCMADYDCAFSNPSQSLMVADLANAADGLASATGVSQSRAIPQLNATAARIGTSAATPADGELMVSGTVTAAALDGTLGATTPATVAATTVRINGSGGAYVGVGEAPIAGAMTAIKAYNDGVWAIRIAQTNAGSSAFGVSMADNGDLRFARDVNSVADAYALTIAHATGLVSLSSGLAVTGTVTIDDGDDHTTALAGSAALMVQGGNTNNDFIGLRFATSAGGSIGSITGKATTTGAYPTSVGQLEFAVQNGASHTTALTIASNGRVGINMGATAPGKLLSVNPGVAGDGILIYESDSVNYSMLSEGYSNYAKHTLYRYGDACHIITSGGETVFNEPGHDLDFRVESDTVTNALALDGATGVVTFGAGINLGAENLSTYDEGSWTPTMLGNDATKTAAANNFGRYTKIGDLVTLMGTVHWDGTETIGAYPRIGGFPFTTNATAGYRSAGSVGGTAGITLSAGYVDFRTTCDAGRTDCYIIQSSLTGYAHTSGMVGDTGAIYGFAFTYKV